MLTTFTVLSDQLIHGWPSLFIEIMPYHKGYVVRLINWWPIIAREFP